MKRIVLVLIALALVVLPVTARERSEVKFGGSPYFAGRYLLDMQKMSDYVDGLGDYGITESGQNPEGFSDFMLPFVNGGLRCTATVSSTLPRRCP